jgi:N-acetyl-anhydromuramyl-L-alanine amidase AmpD
MPKAKKIPVEDHTDIGWVDHRKKLRDLGPIDSLVLHQAGFKRTNDSPHDYRKVKAHYVITRGGRILMYHPANRELWSSNGFNKRSVAVEFIGNMPSTQGKWYKPEKFGTDQLEDAQIEAGRALAEHLMGDLFITHIFAHRQASSSRGNCPGPDIWSTVGQWAIEELGLKDGGANYTVGDGKSIPDSWRTWYVY